MALHADRPSAIVAGSTGLVGRELVTRLLSDRHTGTVHALMRRDVPDYVMSRRLLKHVLPNLQQPGALPLAYECYIALGTTIRQAGSREAFRAVDHGAVLAIAKAARDAGVKRLALVSALGADASSQVFYNRVKGEIEEDVASLGFDRLVVARPSLLLGDRQALGQPPRTLEHWAVKGLTPLLPWVPAAWRPIPAAIVARALVRVLRADGPAVHVLTSSTLLDAGS